MSQVVERGNMQRAYSQVMRNRGAPGTDGMRCEDLKGWLQVNWPRVKAALLEGAYQPQAVRRMDIPKPQGACWDSAGQRYNRAAGAGNFFRQDGKSCITVANRVQCD